MATKIYWSFDSQSISHVSTEQSFDKDVIKMSKVLGIPADSKFTIHNGNVNSTNADASDSISTAPSSEFTAVSEDAPVVKTRKTTSKLRDMHGDLGGTTTDVLPVSPTDDSVADSSASDWFSDQRI